MFSGSISVNRVTVGIPPTVRNELATVAGHHGLKIPEVIRHVLLEWYQARAAARELTDPLRETKT